MSRNHKTTTLRRRLRVEELLGQGVESSVKIAEILTAEGFTVADRTVRDDIAAIGQEWQRSLMELRHARQMRLVRNADRRNRELEAEWERSKLDKERRRAKTVKKAADPDPDSEGRADASGERDEAEHTTEGRVGDVAFMTEQRHNDEFTARLLGLEQPQKIAPTSPDGNESYQGTGNTGALDAALLRAAVALRAAGDPRRPESGRPDEAGKVIGPPPVGP